MQWIIGGFSHETNTFSNVSTDLAAFGAHTYAVGDEAVETARGTGTGMGGFIDAIEGRGDTFVATALASATPSGLVTREAYEEIAGHIVEGVRQHPDVDGVLLALHGAMVAEGIDDGEGELLGRIRAVAGNDMPIVVVLDLHSHITEEMVARASVIIGFQKYPHTDIYERGVEAAQLIARLATGEVRPVVAMEKPPLIPPCSTCNTEGGLYKELWAEALRPGRAAQIVSTSLFAGFPYADIPPLGFAVLVYADGDEGAARAEAGHLSAMAWDRRREFIYKPTPVVEAVTRALASEAKPVVIPDIADNPGGGGANDSVEILRELMRQGAQSAAIAAIYDPEVVAQAVEAGVGQSLKAVLGAKTDPMHGESVEIEGIVRFSGDGRYQYKGEMTRGAWANMGRSVVIDVDGIRIIVCSERLQQRDPEVFRACGIEPTEVDILVVKSAVHFRAAFGPLAGAIIEADGPGLTALDLSPFPFKRIRRPIFPLDDI
jgi:microcystin degradation protein MlrC